MKQWKRLTALLLSAACLCALIAVPTASASAAVSTFPDVTDPQVGRAVEALRMMGIVSGNGGKYDPQGSLTRAQVCKMAILIMGKGDEADAQANRTIFSDVPGSHWARGYVNLAAQTTVGGGEDGQGGSRLMMGMGDGTFAPDRAITYGEVVTLLLRILGYAKQANTNWPNGAVSTAASVGLTAGFTPPKAGETVTRAQAALLFCNMLTAPMAGGDKDSSFLKNYLHCELEQGTLLLVTDTTTQNGQTGAVKLFAAKGTHNDAPVASAVNTPAAFLVGARGTAVFEKSGKFLTFLPDGASTSKTITIASISGGVLTATDGAKYTPSISTTVWIGNKDTTYSDALTSLNPGTSLTVCFTDAGAIDYIFLHGTSMSLSGGTMVARDKVSGNPFAQLTAGTTDYKIVKNGVAASLSDLKQYDVAAFDPTNKTLYVTDFRVTGVYVSASPNTTMPTKIRISLFDKDFEVLDSAVDDLKNLKLNSGVTLLLSPDGKVAGAVSSSTLRSNMVGYLDKDSRTTNYETDSETGKKSAITDVTVHLVEVPAGFPKDFPRTVSAKYYSIVESYADCLFTVTGTRSGTTNSISLSRLSGQTSSGALNLTTRMLGDKPLADNLVVFDRIANSGIKRVSLADIAMNTVPAGKIAYQRTNASGKVDLIVLNDVTGDLYTYGKVTNGEQTGGADDMKYTNRLTIVTNSKNKNSPLTVIGGTSYKDGQFIGLAASVEKLSGTEYNRHAASVALKSVEKVTPSNFNLSTGRFFSGSIELPVWDGVQCYNTQTKDWFRLEKTENETDRENAMRVLNACLAYSSNLTVYYDRDPAQGGKVRVVVAN